MEPKKFYSPNQILGGSFWGGPIASVYFLRSNYLALGKTVEAQKTLIFGAIFIVALLGILPFLPENFPNIAIPLAYCLAAKQIAVTTQLGKLDIAETDDYIFASNWGIFGFGALTMVTFLFVAIVVVFIMESVGLISLT